MATRAEMTFAREGNVELSFVAAGPGEIPSEGWLELGCPKGTWTFGSSTASIDDGLDNWCTAVEALIEGASPGAKTITLSGSMELVISDDSYLAMLAAEAANNYAWFRMVIEDSAEANEETFHVGGYFTQFDHNFNGTGPSDVTVTFRASERHLGIS